jgi:uncharacterized protein DUF6152
MRARHVIVSIAAVALLAQAPLIAHHGAAAYEVGKKVVLKGTVKQWIYSNPHCLLTLEVTGEDGQVVQWIVEGQAPNVVFPAGYRKDTFTFGDKVTVTVEPVKNGRPLGRFLAAVTADGQTLGPANSGAGNANAASQPQ